MGLRTIPLDAVAKWHTSTGAMAVNHINQFTSVTFGITPMPGVPLSKVTDFIDAAAAKVVPPTMKAQYQGEALTFRSTLQSLTVLLFLAVFVMYVILGIPVRKLSAPDYGAVRSAGRTAGRSWYARGCLDRKPACTPTSACSC